MVSMLNSVSSYSVIVRPGQCLYTSPTSNSSKHLPNCISTSLSYLVEVSACLLFSVILSGGSRCPAVRFFADAQNDKNRPCYNDKFSYILYFSNNWRAMTRRC